MSATTYTPSILDSSQVLQHAYDDATQTLRTTASGSALPTGAATSAKQDTGNASLASIDAGTPAALGQTTMTASMPVVLSSDQSVIPVSEILNGATLSTTLTLDTTAQILKVGGSNQTNRGAVMIQPSTNNARFSFNSDKTHPFVLYKSQLEIMPFGPGITIYLFTTTGTDSCVIAEVAHK